MDKKEKEEIHNVQGQWFFVVFATVFALLVGTVVSAIYELLRTNAHWSPWLVLAVFGVPCVWMLDVFTYMFENLEALRKDPSDSMWPVLQKYFVMRYHGGMNILKHWIWPIVGGFIVASIIMLIFEWINHFIFPLPAGLDQKDTAAVQAFTASLPWTAYILVFLGWAVGAFEGGCTTAWLAGETRFRVTAVLAVLLVLGGLADMAALGFPPVAMALGLLILAVAPYGGFTALNAFQKKKMAEMAAQKS